MFVEREGNKGLRLAIGFERNLGLRWQFSILLFTAYTSNVFGLTMGITLIWLLNMVIPAIIGLILLLGSKVQKS